MKYTGHPKWRSNSPLTQIERRLQEYSGNHGTFQHLHYKLHEVYRNTPGTTVPSNTLTTSCTRTTGILREPRYLPTPPRQVARGLQEYSGNHGTFRNLQQATGLSSRRTTHGVNYGNLRHRFSNEGTSDNLINI